VTDEVRQAIEELGESFPGHDVRTLEDGEGGAYVLVEALDLGERYAPRTSWVGFHVTHPYPDADVYPHFIAGETQYLGTGASANGYPEGMAPSLNMPGFDLPAIQISRRSNRWNPDRDTAAFKLSRILEWIRSEIE
jgi:hypothetical protein